MLLDSVDSDTCVSLTIIDDFVLENTEYLTVSLSLIGNWNNRIRLSPATAPIFIIDDDSKIFPCYTLRVQPILLFLLGVNIGLVQSVYEVSEQDMSVVVCVDVLQGILGIPVHLSLSTHSMTSQGLYA